MALKTDLELVEDFQRGRIEGFNELLRRYQEKVYWIARRIIGTHEDANDIVQDVFIRVYGGLKSFRGESGFYTWIYRIATNVSLNTLRSKRFKDFIRFDEIIEETQASGEETDRPIQHQEYQTILEQAIQSLPTKQRLVFVMRYYDELPYSEIAKILKKSEGGLKANYFHAFKKIQEYVRREMNR